MAIVNVPPGKGEPAHEHADIRFFMATQAPDAIRPESAHAPLRWLSLPEARETTSEPNLRETLARLEPLLALSPGFRPSKLPPRLRALASELTATDLSSGHERYPARRPPGQARHRVRLRGARRARAIEDAGGKIIHLEIGEPDFPTAPHIVEAAVEALRAGATHYVPAPGILPLRQAVAPSSSAPGGWRDPGSRDRDPGSQADHVLHHPRPGRRG